MNKIKKFVSLVLAITGLSILANPAGLSYCEDVRRQLMSLKQQLGDSLSDYRQLREEIHELGLITNSTFVTMSQYVSANWTNVIAGIDLITTNSNERLLVLYAGVGAGETNFLSRIDCLADMVSSNSVSLAELRFYKTQCAIVDHSAANSLIVRYQEPAISNLIMKLNAVGIYPQGVSDIFSGEAKELYLDAVNDGLIGP